MNENSVLKDSFILDASQSDDAKVIKWLLKQDPNLCYASWDVEVPRDYLFTTLISRPDIVKLVYKLKPEILHYEDNSGLLPIYHWLANVDLDKSFAIELIEASLSGREDRIKQAYHCVYACAIFIYPIDDTRIEIIKWLVNQYPELTQYQSDYGDFCIHTASAKGCEPLLKFLIEKDSSLLFKKNSSGCYPIPHFDVGDVDFVWSILKKYPQLITATNNSGEWAMHYAVRADSLELCKWIMSQVERSPSGGYVLKQAVALT